MSDFNLVHLHFFQVEILGVTDGSSPEYFYKIEGLSSSLRMEAYTPGGSNRPSYLSNGCETADLILTRPLVEGKTKLSFWCENTIDKQVFDRKQVHVFVLNKENKILARWTLEEAYPKAIAISPFVLHQEQQTVIGETITIGYARLARVK
ncbi:MAG: phage tail protein [Amoebophilaceae bacterium]|nr:phage tail protein [Amoebophilaceae bacterium]